MPKKLIEIASEIVQSQVSLTSMTAADIASSLRQVFSTLHALERAESGEIELPKVQEPEQPEELTPADSIQNDKVICLECGAEFKQLTQRHLLSHGMSPKEYKAKYGFTMRTSLAARAVSKARSRVAKKRGLPENLQKYIETKRRAKTEVSKPAAESNKPETERVKRVRKRFSPKTA